MQTAKKFFNYTVNPAEYNEGKFSGTKTVETTLKNLTKFGAGGMVTVLAIHNSKKLQGQTGLYALTEKQKKDFDAYVRNRNKNKKSSKKSSKNSSKKEEKSKGGKRRTYRRRRR